MKVMKIVELYVLNTLKNMNNQMLLDHIDSVNGFNSNIITDKILLSTVTNVYLPRQGKSLAVNGFVLQAKSIFCCNVLLGNFRRSAIV